MTPTVVGVLGLGFFLLLMFLGLPIPFSLIFSGVAGLTVIQGPLIAGEMLASELLSVFTNYTYTVGPLFGLMGFIASFSGIGSSLFNAINSFIGHRRGGLAMATQIACAGFGAICGSPPATISTFSAIAYPEMRKLNYSPSLAGPTIAAGSALAVLIPPSSVLIIYGLITDTSIGQLFMAGILPGILLCALNILAVVYIGKRHPDWAPTSRKYTWSERFQSVKNGGLLEVAFVFILSMGGMFAGFFTPTEAAAVGAFGMFIATVAGKNMNFRRFLNSLLAGIRLQAMVFMLLASASLFGRLFTISMIPMRIGSFVQNLDVANWVIMLVILLIYFVLGMLVDLLPMMIVTMPIFFPIVCNTLGYDPLWFGICMTILVQLGGITPPVGTCVFMLQGCINDKDATLAVLFKGVWPFVWACCGALVLLMAFPALATILADLAF